MAMKFYLMERKGIFHPIHDTSNQCKDIGHKHYEYLCKVAFNPSTKLDDNDFLIDHMDIDSTIQGCLIHGSCERMHKTIMNNLLRKLESQGINVKAIKITIIPRYPDAMANLTYIYSDNESSLAYLI